MTLQVTFDSGRFTCGHVALEAHERLEDPCIAFDLFIGDEFVCELTLAAVKEILKTAHRPVTLYFNPELAACLDAVIGQFGDGNVNEDAAIGICIDRAIAQQSRG